jgi:hypothetical protein
MRPVDALCGFRTWDTLSRLEREGIHAGYVAYKCPMCGYYHQAWDSKPLRRLLAQYPDTLISDGPHQ